MSGSDKKLTGIWHGLYSYPRFYEPVYFVATLIAFGDTFSGTTHEAAEGRAGAPLKSFAQLEGNLTGQAISFVKTYDGSAGRNHAINYEGTLSGDGMEIEGTWQIPHQWSGRFLMIRNAGATEQVVRKVYETVR
jgi:hypothetical protein